MSIDHQPTSSGLLRRARSTSPQTPMTSSVFVAVVVAMVTVVLLGAVAPSVASAELGSPAVEGEHGKVLIVAAPRLTWETIQEFAPPNMVEFFESAAVGMSSPRTVGSTTSPGEAYLTISAGNRASSKSTLDGSVVELTEDSEAGNTIEEYIRATGVTPSGKMVALGIPSIERTNESLLFGAEPGTLVSALSQADMVMGAIANADHTLGVPKYRHAALSAIDLDGQVFAGAVGQDLLAINPVAPYGLELDHSVVLDVFDTTWPQADVTLVELSDLERAENGRSQATTAQADRLFEQALARSDELFGELLSRADLENDLVIFVSPTPPGPRNVLTPFAVAGDGFGKGLATSSTTRRDGYVSLTDIAPTVLNYLGIEVPSAMGNTRISAAPDSSSVSERIDWMVRESDRAIARDRAFEPLTVTFIVLIVIMLALATVSLALYRSMAGGVRFLSLSLLGILPASYLMGLLPTEGAPTAVMGALMFGGGMLLAAVATRLSRFDSLAPPVALLALLWLVLAIDVVTGGHLQINTIFGYSPIVAGRFAGFGNQAYSMFALASLLLGAYFVEVRATPGERTSRSTLGIVGAFYLATIVLDGHPSFGSDVGGVLSFAPAAAISMLLFAQRKIRVRTLLLIGGVTVAALGGFAALDLTRDPESQTHMGRFVTQLFDGQAGEIFERKLAANLRVLTAVWAWIIPAALVYIGYLNWRPTQTMRMMQQQHQQFKTFGVSALILGVGAMALNDSGVSMPAIMLAISLAYVTYMVLGVSSAFADRPRGDDG